MKVVSIVALSLALISSTASAAGVEELCHKSAEQSVVLKANMNANPEFLQKSLEMIAEEKMKQSVKDSVRETLYYVYNRRTMSDEDIRRLSFIRCLTRLN